MALEVDRPTMPLHDSVRLAPYSASEHRSQVQGWLARPHVARWWGDPDEAMEFIDQHAIDEQAVIMVDDDPVGYIAWQQIPEDEREAANLSDLPEGHVDIDLFIGEPRFLARGFGSAALRLVVAQLEGRGVPSIGLAAASDNTRALRAYEKAGFGPFRDFVENGQRMIYLRRAAETR